MAGGYPNSATIFRDLFRRIPRSTELGDAWQVESGSWSIVDTGAVHYAQFTGAAAEARILIPVQRANFQVAVVPRPAAGDTYRKYRLQFTCQGTGATGYLESPAAHDHMRGIRFVYNGVERWNDSSSLYPSGQIQYGFWQALRVWSEEEDDPYQIVEFYYQYGYFGPVNYYPVVRIPKMTGPVWISIGGDADAEPLGFSSVEIKRLEYQDLERPCLSKPTRLCDDYYRSSVSSCLKLTIAGVKVGNGYCQCACINDVWYLRRFVWGYEAGIGSCGWQTSIPSDIYAENASYPCRPYFLHARVNLEGGRYLLTISLTSSEPDATAPTTVAWQADMGTDPIDATNLDVSAFTLITDESVDCDYSEATLHAEAVDGDACPEPEEYTGCVLLEDCGEDPPQEVTLAVTGVEPCPDRSEETGERCRGFNRSFALTYVAGGDDCRWVYEDDDWEASLWLTRSGTDVTASGSVRWNHNDWYAFSYRHDLGPLPIAPGGLNFETDPTEILGNSTPCEIWDPCDYRAAKVKISA